MKEPKVPRYSQLMTQLCLRLKITAWSENEALAVARSFMPNHAAIAQTAMNGIHTSPAFSPSAVPFCALGKKKLMLAMLEAKLPPPKPHSSASSTKVE